MGHTWVFILYREDTSGINSNASLVTQYQPVNGNYQIIRDYPTYTNIYNSNTQNYNVSYPTGYTAAATSGKWYMVAHTYYKDDQNTITMFNNAYPNGSSATTTHGYNWQWWGTGGSRALFIGGSEWGSNVGEPYGAGSNSINSYGAIGMMAHYNTPLAESDLKIIFDYYQSQFDFG